MLKNIKNIQQNILSWYANSGRKLPRRMTKDPYAIHVSEVMLQQTQVDRVIPYFHQRMKDFPDYKTLANASKTDLLSHRSGLGFNSRALRLQTCAQTIMKNWKLKIENWLVFKNWKLEIRNWADISALRAELQKLPGIGPYTSAAIMAFSRNLPVPVIDTNIRRVLIFLFKLPETITAKALEAFAETVIPQWKSRDWHNALMDQWALLLTARKTKIKPLSKQSKFEWSDRQVRWWILKKLVKTASICPPLIKEGRCEAQEDLLKIENIEEEFPHKEVKKIVKELQKEGLIQIKKWIVSIAE